MHSPSLENSYHENQADQIIQDSLRTREYLEETSNQLIQYFEELAEESDPKRAYEITLRQRRQKDRKYDQMLAQNISLNHKVKNLEAEVHSLGLQNQTLLSYLNKSGQSLQKLKNQRASQIKVGESPHESSRVPSLWISESKQRIMDGLDQQLRLAREIQVFEVQQIRKIQCSVQILMERIQKIIDFNKFQQSIQVDPNYPQKTVVIPQAKYQKLIDFYFQHSVLLSRKRQEKSSPESSQSDSDNPSLVKTQQFEPSSKQEIISEQENPTSLEIDELRQLFTELAQRNGLGKQWSLYLKNTQSQAEEFRSQIQSIAKCEFDINKKIRCQGIMRKINQSCVSKNTQEQTTIQTQKKELQQVLFQKIVKLLQKLSFDQRQLDLFYQFDQKRKNDRLFSLDEFINKFKSKQDLAEISKEYTLKFLQTLNLLVMKILHLLANIQPSEADKVSKLFEWIKSRFDSKSNQARSSMLNVLEKEIEKYLDEKNNEKTKKNRSIDPIPTPKFDREKLFENQLKRIVNEYQQLFESTIFNCRRQVKWILK